MAVNPTPAPSPTGLHITWSWSLLAALAVALAGVAGTIVTPIWGHLVATTLSDILQAMSGILLLLGGGTASAIAFAHVNSKLRMNEMLQLSAIRLSEYRSAKDYDLALEERRRVEYPVPSTGPSAAPPVSPSVVTP